MKSIKLVNRNLGFIPEINSGGVADDVYYKRTTDASFNSKANWTFVQFYEYPAYLSPVNAAPFSMYDGDSVDSGFYILGLADTYYIFVGNGADAVGTVAVKGHIAALAEYGGASDNKQEGGLLNCIAASYDASSNTLIGYTFNSGVYQEVSATFSSSNWGVLGTNTEIRVGNHMDGDSDHVYQCPDAMKIGSTSLWYSTLSKANICALNNISSSVSHNDNDIGMVYNVGYTGAGVTQPNHQWFGTFASTLDGTDTGSTGAKTLTGVNSPNQGNHPL
jgi:hypothetical protein